MSRRAALVTCAALLAGCAEDTAYLVVHVANRPAVHSASALEITLANAGSMRTDQLPLNGAGFPVTFSISAPDRAGPLDISVEALDADGLVVGRGATSTTIEDTAANVFLDTTDFVVNTDVTDDQYPSNDFEAHGLQLASSADGTWTVAYRSACTGACEILARRFDANGRPQPTVLGAGTDAFSVSTLPTTDASIPAAAHAGATTLVAWDYIDPPGTIEGIACRALDAQGSATLTQRLLAIDPAADVVAVAPLESAGFALTWSALQGGNTVIRSMTAQPDCTTRTAPVTVSAASGLSGRRAAVATSGQPARVLYAWLRDSSVRVRIADANNTFLIPDTEFVARTALEGVEAVRVAPLGSGFAVVVRWASPIDGTAPGRIELFRTNAMGAALGGPITVTTQSGSDFLSAEAFGVATRSDGVLMVTWHACDANGDGSGCGVWGRAFSSDGIARGPAFGVPTTTTGDQTGPSVAAVGDAFAFVWRDTSGAAPDASGTAVRARIVYLP